MAEFVNREGLTQFGWVLNIITPPPTLSHPGSLIISDAALLNRADQWADASSPVTTAEVSQGYRGEMCYFGPRFGAADPPQGSPRHLLQPGLSQNVPAAAAAAGPQQELDVAEPLQSCIKSDSNSWVQTGNVESSL